MRSLFAPTWVTLSVIVAFPAAARAQTFINPFATVTLTSPSPVGGRSQVGFGVSFGSVGRIVGAEAEVAYYPQVLDNQANGLAKSHVLTFGGSTLIGPKIGPVKVYGAIGLGDLVLNVQSVAGALTPTAASLTNHYVTLNTGGGAMGFLVKHLGVRGDLRYYRAYGFTVTDLQSSSIRLGHFAFWRATVGAVFTF